jgi:ribosome-associated toxin RatA of RatAB toxin-antitoxin module
VRTVNLAFATPDVQPAEAFARLSDFPRYPTMTDTVHEVTVHDAGEDGSMLSSWTVQFRSGLLRWTERDVLDAAERTITFTQVEGDFHRFEGRWGVAERSGVTAVTFDAEFDLGMASLEALLDPIAERALTSNITVIVEGLMGRAEPVEAS